MDIAIPQHDWMDLIGFWFTILGTIVTVLGLLLTLKAAREAREQAAGARTSADAARVAADKAANAISERTTIADLASLRSGFQSIIGLLEVNRLELALFEVRLARQRVNEVRQRPGFEGPTTELQSVITDLAGLQELLEERQYGAVTTPLPMTDICKSLSMHVDSLSTWAERMRYNGQVAG